MLKTVDLFFLSLWCHLKKPNAISPPSLPPPSLPASSLHLMLSLFLHCLTQSLSGKPNRITSAARSKDSFLSTPALSGCSAGVFEILARCGGPAGGRLPSSQRWVPGFLRRTGLKLRHQKYGALACPSCISTSPKFTADHWCECGGRTLRWRKNAQAAGSPSNELILVWFGRQSLDKNSTNQRSEPYVILMCLTSENSETFSRD